MPAYGRGYVGFVGEDEGYGLSQFLAQCLLVGTHRHIDELLRHALGNKVHVWEARRPAAGLCATYLIDVVVALAPLIFRQPVGYLTKLVARPLDAHIAFAGQRGQGGPLPYESLALIVGLGHLVRHMPAPETAGVGVLVVDVNLQAQLAPLLEGVLPQAHPFLAQVFRHQPWPGMHQGTAEALRLQFEEHTVYVGFADVGIPYPQGGGPVLGRGSLELGLNLAETGFRGLFLLAGAQQRKGQGLEENLLHKAVSFSFNWGKYAANIQNLFR